MSPDVDVKIKRLDKDLPLPCYARPSDAGMDLLSRIDIEIPPQQRACVPTGIAVAIPEGFAGYVQPRSGLAVKKGLSIVNTPGLIDAGYRGEIVVIAINTDTSCPIEIKRGDRIAQLVILQVPVVNLEEVEELDATERGARGFGSTGL